jgi:hypothetical protein
MLKLTTAERVEIEQVIAGEIDLSSDLYDKIYDYVVSNTNDMPYGTAKARDGDPFEWVLQNLQNYI